MTRGWLGQSVIGGAEAPRSMLQTILELGQRRPAGVGLLALVLVRLAVQVETAHGAEPGAVGPAEDLVGQRQDEPVPRPRGQVEPVLDHIRRRQLLDAVRALRLVFAQREILVQDGVAEAAEAGSVEPNVKAKLVDGAGRGA